MTLSTNSIGKKQHFFRHLETHDIKVRQNLEIAPPHNNYFLVYVFFPFFKGPVKHAKLIGKKGDRMSTKSSSYRKQNQLKICCSKNNLFRENQPMGKTRDNQLFGKIN